MCERGSFISCSVGIKTPGGEHYIETRHGKPQKSNQLPVSTHCVWLNLFLPTLKKPLVLFLDESSFSSLIFFQFKVHCLFIGAIFPFAKWDKKHEFFPCVPYVPSLPARCSIVISLPGGNGRIWLAGYFRSTDPYTKKALDCCRLV